MGISKPSIYRVFGSKEQLFRLAVDHFVERYAGFFFKALDEITVAEVVRDLIDGMIRSVTAGDTPPGSLLAQGAMACARENEEMRVHVLCWRRKFEQLLAQRLARARDEGEFARETDCRAVARYVTALCDGIALQAKSGAARPALRGIRDIALAGIFGACDAAATEHGAAETAAGVGARCCDGQAKK